MNKKYDNNFEIHALTERDLKQAFKKWLASQAGMEETDFDYLEFEAMVFLDILHSMVSKKRK